MGRLLAWLKRMWRGPDDSKYWFVLDKMNDEKYFLDYDGRGDNGRKKNNGLHEYQ